MRQGHYAENEQIATLEEKEGAAAITGMTGVSLPPLFICGRTG